jgi:Tol biopolymer transport system component
MRKITVFILLALLFITCSPRLTIDFSQVSVPEEGGMRFIQLTKDNNDVIGPYVGINAITGLLEWYAAPFIALSPDGSQIAFSAQKKKKVNIYLKSASEGGGIVQRTFREYILDMAYSPDGKNIAFTDKPSGDKNIYMINAKEGAAVQQITTTRSDELGPHFSADGQSIFFTKLESGRYYIWNYNLNTAILTQYSEGFTPVPTPDGKTLIITRTNPDTRRGEIWSIDLKRGTETLLLSDPTRGFSSPAINKDGAKIVCVGTSLETKTRPENLDLFMFNINGTGLTQLTFHAGSDVSPIWGADGKSIFFLSQRGSEKGHYNVWKINI